MSSEDSLSNNWLSSLKIYLHPRSVAMLFLGFSSGLPLLLVFGTLSFWLREAGVERSVITYFSWVGLAYGLKWLWAPLIDRLPLPILSTWLGRRRSWMFLSQCLLIASLAGLAFSDPLLHLNYMALLAIAVAFSSATQDIVIDAYRIESAGERLQAAMAATYMAGYRLAMIVAGAGVLALAAWVDIDPSIYSQHSWQVAYLCMAALMGTGLITTMMIAEPAAIEMDQETLEQQHKITAKAEQLAHLPQKLSSLLGWGYIAVICPFADFIRRYGKQALIILALIGTYRISDVILGIIANIFYVDMGFSKQEVATIIKVYGVIMTILGAGLGGILVNRYGVMKILFTGALLAAGTNLLFAWLATLGHDTRVLTLVISLDNLSGGIATAAFIAYLSSLTNIQYSATQYALFSSVMLLFPKFLGGFSGGIVDSLNYAWFFTGTAVLGIPVLILVWMAAKITPIKAK
ncbi:AmpG family muropeptide MFS transporter [Neptunomonas antarctica]|uniref:MFS transporter, PAT family, beta-lactamase induction signal transducer AmpG n=1 Tax=Neptunomonas antarctica TaxID=619304 RepID=A0A1N7LZR4_9GAMM|nr:MFS transporter [Neptunomonas antarctica]SIS79303.1 MFS transporter, PAT family, beta-lactamase induction signal transducer AmpG [Neptunomonas antarctica]